MQPRRRRRHVMLAAPHPTHSATVLPAAYHATHPRRTVPFIRDGELVLNESNTIVSYLANKYNRDGIYPESPEDLATAWQWLGERHPTPPHSRTSVAHRSGGSGVGGHAGRQAEAGRPTGLRLRGCVLHGRVRRAIPRPSHEPSFFRRGPRYVRPVAEQDWHAARRGDRGCRPPLRRESI